MDVIITMHYTLYLHLYINYLFGNAAVVYMRGYNFIKRFRDFEADMSRKGKSQRIGFHFYEYKALS